MAKNYGKSELQTAAAAIAHEVKRPQAVQVFSELLNFDRAPKGDIKTDFKTALYVCAATKHGRIEDFVSNGNLIMLGFSLSSVGFEGPTQDFTVQDYIDTLQELIDEGALEYVGEGAGFVSAGFKRVAEGMVSCAPSQQPSNLTTSELRFTDEGGVYPLFSKFVVIPGDKVRVVINTFLNTAYVQSIVTMRKMLIGEASENNMIYFRERGIANAYHIDTTKDGVPFSIGDLVITEIVARKSPNVLIIRPREVVHGTGSLHTFICKAVLDHNIPSTWPDTVKHSIKNIPEVVQKNDIKGRVDLRDLPLVTIDSEDARDFDDAVYCKKEGDKFRLYVAIADVSYYVRTGSAIDAEALERTTSVYFPFYVIPMLPKELSNGICSLNPNVDRLCMVCEMVVDKDGKIGDYEFYPAVMNSHARLTYTEAHAMITEDRAIDPEHEKCIPWIKDLYELYQAFDRARDKRGVFEFESTEVHFLFNERWKVKGIEPDYRNEAHKLIEECMIAANICAASFVGKYKYETLYRIHEKPTPEKLDKLRTILSRYGIDLRHQYEPTPLDFRDVSNQVMKLSDGIHQVISLQLLRAMSKAKYSPENVGHFGLALENYAHFTSPIRRYPDLQIHRVIKYILEKQQKREWGKIGSQRYTHDALVNLGMRCSEREIASSDAEYDVDNSLKCEYVKNFIGEVVDGTISTVMSNGAFVTLNDFFIDGMLSSRSLMRIDANTQTIFVDQKSKYSVGDQIKVRVAEVNSLYRFITLVPVTQMRKSDARFDLKEQQDRLKATASKKLEINNDSKDELFGRLGDISRGVQAKEGDGVVREHITYSLANNLDLSKSVEAILGEDTHLLDAAAEAAEIAGEEEKKARAAKAKAAPKATAKAKSKTTKSEDDATAVIKVKRKSKSAQSTEVIELESKSASKAKKKAKDDIDELLVDTASRIDADIAPAPKTAKSTKKSTKSTETKESAKTTKSTASKSRSNAKAKEAIPEAVLEHEIEGETKVTVKVKTRPSAKKVDKALQEMVDAVKPEKKQTVSKSSAAKATAKVEAAKSKATASKAKATTATKATTTKATAAKTTATKAKATTATKATAAKSTASKAKATTATKATAAKATTATKATAAKTTSTKAKATTATKATAAKSTATKAKATTATKASAAKTTATKAKATTASKATAAKTTATKAKATSASKATAAKSTATKAKATTATKATAAKTTATKAKATTATKASAAKTTATKAKATASKDTAAKTSATKAKATASKATAAKAKTTAAKTKTTAKTKK
ncbi:MAG: VacB/RNase II family 3'-5' exoribonuclease [Anaerobiospirillum succiniciproducens]|uniref:ribonuclease R family protein n=1 Tax=Anaerobiospirillum succiniciproducens TaxID=13335 RepID=UPI002A74C15F|nr:VacB/RNase II family 3'-5' exoribonuclease [Anaerobiospirillum succiniciproducens]MDY2797672.1 VacB/RNase II family 3'-5' exoribonuclease [Anaerobiospirillum succiniciproducens]